jgi:hypothetical protein
MKHLANVKELLPILVVILIIFLAVIKVYCAINNLQVDVIDRSIDTLILILSGIGIYYFTKKK